MRWRKKPSHFGKWHRWFAWHPVPLLDAPQWAWLETVWRKQYMVGHYFPDVETEYKTYSRKKY